MLNDLIKLIQENPELPVIPMVETDVVCGDEYGYWMASMGNCAVKEYAVDEWYGDGIIRCRDMPGAEEDLIEAIAECKYEGSDEDYEKAKEEAEKLWTKAIIVYIVLPD